MQKCKECSIRFNYWDVFKSIWSENYAPIVCRECGSKYYVGFSTKLILCLSLFTPLIIVNFADLSFDRFYVKYFMWLFATLFIVPFIARYHIKVNDDQNDSTKALLASHLNKMEADVITSILESYEIPYFKVSRGIGAIEMFFRTHHLDIYVKPYMLQMSKELINPHNNE